MPAMNDNLNFQVTATHHVTYRFNCEFFTIALDLLNNVDVLKTLTEIPIEKKPPSKA